MFRATPILFLLLVALLPGAGAAPLRTLAWDQSVSQRKLAVAFGQKQVAIEGMHHGQRTEAIRLPEEPGKVRLLDLEKRDEEGMPLAVPLRIPAGCQRPLLILIPNEQSPIGLRPLVLEDSPARFAWGSFNILNATDRNLVARFYDKQLVPLRASAAPVNFAPPRGSRATMPVQIHDPGAESKNLLYSDTWEFGADLRQLVIVVPRTEPDNRGPLEFKFIVEHRLDFVP